MKLEGSLDTFPMRELIEMIGYSSVTGALNIYGPMVSGHLYFREGLLYHADSDALIGVDAMAAIISQSQSRFTFVSDVVSAEESLWGNAAQHVQAAERLAARWQEVRARINNLEQVPVLLVNTEQIQRRVGPAALPVVEAINGRLSLREIAEQLSWGKIEVSEVVAQLISDRLVELHQSDEQPQIEASPKPVKGGLFDRIRGKAAPIPQAQTSGEDPVLQLLRG